ncbi:Uncharacterised protein [uncultured archaeon]|nr:Uncharacterised protein [uncultured archaeon]
MFESLKIITEQSGISIALLVIIILWTFIWKIAALIKAAKNRSAGWVIVFALINTVGILEILYIFVFSKIKPLKKSEKPRKRKKRK